MAMFFAARIAEFLGFHVQDLKVWKGGNLHGFHQ